MIPQGYAEATFAGIQAKIDRAGEHIDTLNQEIFTWAQGHPCSAYSEPKGASREHRIYVRFDPEPDARRWGLLLGDAVHNLRSALDHLVYELAVGVSHRRPPPGWRHLEFPILDDSHHWRGPKDRRLKGLSHEMRTAIETVQPYKSGPVDIAHSDKLWIVHELDNADKHREIRPVALLPAHFSATFGTISGGEMTATSYPGPLKNETLLMTLTGEAVMEMEDNAETEIGVAVDIGMPIPLHVSGLMDALFQRVSTVAGNLYEAFFTAS
jgi:hypothetical protein